MAVNEKNGIGLCLTGFVFAVLGAIFSSTGNSGVGMPIIAMGVVFVFAGVSVLRKGPPHKESPLTRPPAERPTRRA